MSERTLREKIAKEIHAGLSRQSQQGHEAASRISFATADRILALLEDEPAEAEGEKAQRGDETIDRAARLLKECARAIEGAYARDGMTTVSTDPNLMAAQLLNTLNRHDCEAWRDEGIGCAKCNPIAQEIAVIDRVCGFVETEILASLRTQEAEPVGEVVAKQREEREDSTVRALAEGLYMQDMRQHFGKVGERPTPWPDISPKKQSEYLLAASSRLRTHSPEELEGYVGRCDLGHKTFTWHEPAVHRCQGMAEVPKICGRKLTWRAVAPIGQPLDGDGGP